VPSQSGPGAAWDAEYAAGRYRGEPPVAFTGDILQAARPRHEVTERHPDGRLTVRYLTGPKQGLLIHFFADAELGELFAAGFTPVLPLRLQRTRRDPPQPGQWSQWEAIWRKTMPPQPI
jgi:hypothetical protein